VRQSASLTVDWLDGSANDNDAACASAAISTATSSLLSADGDTLVSASGDEIRVAGSSIQAKVLLHNSVGDYLHTEGVRLRVGDDGTNGSWSLEAFSLAYQILPGLNRRVQ
jgi:hypothetical protein